jgi:hypothetical protein
MGKLRGAAVILVAWMLPAVSFGQPLSPSPLDPEWRLVAEADYIVRARLEVPKGELDNAIRTGKGDHNRIKLHVIEVIKGSIGVGPIECVYWSGGEDYTPSPRAVLSLDGSEVLAFTHEWGKDEGYIAHDKRAIRPYEPGKAEQVRREVLNQRLIADSFAKLPAAKPDEFEGAVKGLIAKMLAEKTQQEAVYALQRLDPRAAPSIIRLMDDRRPLVLKHTQFLNTAPGAFEGIVHYGPVVAVDALSAVLPELTREGFGQIYNGGSEKDRRQVVDAWRTYLHYRLASRTAPESRALPPVPTKQSPANENP